MKKIFTLLTLTLLFTTGAWAEDITIDFTTKGYGNQQTIESVTQDGITITFDKGTNSNAPKYYNTGTAIRCYGGNTFTATATGKKITKIAFTFGSSDGSNEITAEPGTFSTDTWTGNTESVTFTIGGTSGHRRLLKMIFTVAADGDSRQATAIEFAGGYQTKFTYGVEGDGVNLPTATVKAGDNVITGATVTWTAEKASGSDNLTPTITGNKVNIPSDSYGKINVTASYAGDATSYQPSSKSYIIDVYKGYMDIKTIVDDYKTSVVDGGANWNNGIPVSFWLVKEEGSSLSPICPTVTYANGAYTYIADNDNNSLLLYGNGLGFSKGDIITSDQGGGEFMPLYGNLKTYSGLLELEVIQNNFMVQSSGATVTPQTISASQLSEPEFMNAYLKIENAVYVSTESRNCTFTIGGTNITVHQNWTNVSISELEAGATYTLEGMGAKYNNTAQLYLISFEKTAEPTAIVNIKTDNDAENAPIYNLAGQKVTDSYKGVVIQKGKKRLNK